MFLDKIAKRISVLNERLAKLDIHLIEVATHSNEKKRSTKLYFNNVGNLSAYKCITKGFAYEHVVEYLAFHLVKMRTWELILLTC